MHVMTMGYILWNEGEKKGRQQHFVLEYQLDTNDAFLIIHTLLSKFELSFLLYSEPHQGWSETIYFWIGHFFWYDTLEQTNEKLSHK